MREDSHINLLLCVFGFGIKELSRARFERRKDGKYLTYVPVNLAEDSMFPFKTKASMKLKISFKTADNKVIVEKWNETSEE